ncbi:MAG: RNA polymerase sigma factor [Flavobacteriales bacterium]|nr:RNA polymerase sigma factor [Bacteroidota bacterium]MCB9241818.1 RNA polymerase sigma factor [Flavobacteriales bacterium]
MSEEELIKGCIREDRTSQGLLYERYANKMYAICLRYSNSREEAEDVLQDAFMKIFDKISLFRGEGSFEGWMRRIMVNTALRSRDKRRMKFEPGDLDDVEEPSVEASVIDQMGTKEIMNLLHEMPEGYRVVFNLNAVEGYNHKEIGEMLGINESTSRSQFARARKYLMNLMKKAHVEK